MCFGKSAYQVFVGVVQLGLVNRTGCVSGSIGLGNQIIAPNWGLD